MIRTKLELVFDFDPETGEYFPVSQKVLDDKKPAKKKTAVVKDESTVPELKLEDNKYYLNSAACALIGVTSGDRVDIRYKKIEGKELPIIGNGSLFGESAGNKLTAKLSVGFRGSANTRLSVYGDTFTFEPYRETKGVFILHGNKEDEIEEVQDSNIRLTISEDKEVDIDLQSNDIDDLNIDFNEDIFKL